MCRTLNISVCGVQRQYNLVVHRPLLTVCTNELRMCVPYSFTYSTTWNNVISSKSQQVFQHLWCTCVYVRIAFGWFGDADNLIWNQKECLVVVWSPSFTPESMHTQSRLSSTHEVFSYNVIADSSMSQVWQFSVIAIIASHAVEPVYNTATCGPVVTGL